MRAILIDRYGDNSVVRLGEAPSPTLGARDVRIAVRAASVNPVDFKIRSGELRRLGAVRFPLTLGNDCSGVVTEVGAEVTRFAPGDEVFARVGKDRLGAFADEVAVEEAFVAHKPASLDHVAAAALALVGLTAWQALVDVVKLEKEERVLIHAGSGGVGSIAIQVAKALGAHVTTTAGAQSAALVRELGAERSIDYKTERFDEVLRDYDAVFDTVGGDTRARSFSVLRRGGRMVSITGTPTAAFAREQGLGVIPRAAIAVMGAGTTMRAARRGVHFTYLYMRPSGAQLEELAALAERGALRPLVDRTFPLEQAARALEHVESGRARGKVVLTTS
jgi:NADPH:quinone reductase-like Zn-dependent oxidoreductase